MYGWYGLQEHVLGRADLDDPAQVHDRDAVGDRPGEPQVVRHDDDRQPQLVAELHQQLQDLAAHRGVQVGDRLVGHDHVGVQHHGAGDHHALALPAGQLVRVEQEEPLGGSQACVRESACATSSSSVSPFGPC